MYSAMPSLDDVEGLEATGEVVLLALQLEPLLELLLHHHQRE